MIVKILDDFYKLILVNIGSGKKFGWKMSQILREPRGDLLLDLSCRGRGEEEGGGKKKNLR